MYEQKAKSVNGGFYENPVFRGDYPDPSVVRVGDDYWATTTSTEWSPQFPLLHSRDLVHWKQSGAVFASPPEWSAGRYWAPEISYFDGLYYVYYVAKHQDGPLTIGVATAPGAKGPYTDHGPLVGQSSGSIDPTAIQGSSGARFLVWKEDGNSVGLPTTIWIQPLSRDGLRLEGAARSILANDAPWEGNVVEAPSIIRRGAYYYMFYSGNACCGRTCKYAVGVARAEQLEGPWHKYPGNPILKGNAAWRCPGHGSAVEAADGRTFYLYHAYSRRDSIFIGRQTLLDEINWNDAGWPEINCGSPSSVAPLPLREARPRLHLAKNVPAGEWQWPHDRRPNVEFGRGLRRSSIVLGPPATGDDDTLACILARSPHFGDYEASTAFDVRSLAPGVEAGLCAYGDSNNALGLSYRNGLLRVWQRTAGKHRVLQEISHPAQHAVRLRMRARRGYQFTFEYYANGRWQALRTAPLRAANLPPWDRGVRIALTAGSAPHARVHFKHLRIREAQRTS